MVITERSDQAELLPREAGQEHVLQAADVRTPGGAIRSRPQFHQFGRLGHDPVEGLEGEIAQAGEVGKGLFRPINGMGRLTPGHCAATRAAAATA